MHFKTTIKPGNWINVFFIGLLAYTLLVILFSMTDHWRYNDFNHYYASSFMLSHHINPYTTPLKPVIDLFQLNYDEGIPYATNPPLLLYFFLPFSLADPITSFNLWFIFQFLAFIASIYLVKALIHDAYFDSIFLPFICLVSASFPVFLHFISSQVQFFISSTILLAFLLFTRKKYALTLLLLSVVGTLKLYPFYVMPWFFIRMQCSLFHKLLYAAGTALWITCLCAATGFDLWLDFFNHALPIVRDYILLRGWNYSIPSFIANSGALFYPNSTLGNNANTLLNIANAVGLLTLAGTYIFILTRELKQEAEFSLLLIMSLISTPSCWAHYIVLLFLPIAVILKNKKYIKTPLDKVIISLAFFFLLVDVTRFATVLNGFPFLLVLYCPLYSLIVLAFYLAKDRRAKA